MGVDPEIRRSTLSRAETLSIFLNQYLTHEIIITNFKVDFPIQYQVHGTMQFVLLLRVHCAGPPDFYYGHICLPFLSADMYYIQLIHTHIYNVSFSLYYITATIKCTSHL